MSTGPVDENLFWPYMIVLELHFLALSRTKAVPCIIFLNCVIIMALKGLDIYYKHLCQRQHLV